MTESLVTTNRKINRAYSAFHSSSNVQVMYTNYQTNKKISNVNENQRPTCIHTHLIIFYTQVLRVKSHLGRFQIHLQASAITLVPASSGLLRGVRRRVLDILVVAAILFRRVLLCLDVPVEDRRERRQRVFHCVVDDVLDLQLVLVV